MASLLQIENLSISLPAGGDRALAVDGVSLALNPREIVCVVGESGSGKSTLAHAVLGLLPRGLRIAGGDIRLGELQLAGMPLGELRRVRGKRIAMVFQEPLSALNPLMRCGRQIGEMLRTHGMRDAARVNARVAELLTSVGLPDHARIVDSYPYQLSGGQRQRVMIAMALALEPDILIADEPTTALDVTTQAQILALIKDIQQRKGLAVLFITHDFGVVSEIADRIVVMQGGRVIESGSAQQVLRDPQQAYTQSLLAAVPSFRPPPAGKVQADALLTVKNLRKTYVRKGKWFGPAQQFPAVKGVSFDIRRGETVGLVGESGSGKSTIGRMLAGLVSVDDGEVRLRGADMLADGAFADPARRRSVQMIFQDPYGSLNPRHTVARILTGGMRRHGMSASAAMDRARELMQLVKLDPSALDRYPHEFSGGQRQRLGFARAIAVTPELIVADEPVSALDVSVQDQVLAMLRQLKHELHLSMLFITHDLRVASQLCDRVIVLKHGEIVEQGLTAQVLENPQHEYTRELIAAVPGRSWK
ncbi:ABC transporter ATP-binding protein [Achromobacter sp. UMC46]|uniref:ABC transporter ATP-binding protein n=1 Tax=Achromobacter sp. UMC46 TaxID=1862319 RepID=UPI00160468B0|nr:microcin ABC transporter ATP-binding protein [Achromobacter sp. UMC46]